MILNFFHQIHILITRIPNKYFTIFYNLYYHIIFPFFKGIFNYIILLSANKFT